MLEWILILAAFIFAAIMTTVAYLQVKREEDKTFLI